MDPQLQGIKKKAEAGERLDHSDALALFNTQDLFGLGSAISSAPPIDFTGDLKVVAGRPMAKRGRIPGITPNPRLQRVDLAKAKQGVP